MVLAEAVAVAEAADVVGEAAATPVVAEAAAAVVITVVAAFLNAKYLDIMEKILRPWEK